MQNSKSNITIYIVRHGQSSGNIDEDAMAMDTDVCLTDHGKYEALMVARWFKKNKIPISAIYSSNYKRALDTASVIAGENGFRMKDVIGTNSLAELSVGDWSKEKISNMVTPEVDLVLNSKGIDFVWPGGESFRIVERRVSVWLEKEILHNSKYISGNHHIVIVAHGNTIRALFYYILGCNDRLVHRFRLDNCGLSIFNYGKYGWYPITINSTDYLHAID